jgi:hypothetical protein
MSGSTWNRAPGRYWAPLLLGVLLLALPLSSPAADEEECYRCHGLKGFAALRGGEVKNLAVSPEFFESSIHSLVNCRECHSDIAALPHPGASMEISCGQVCHQQNSTGEQYSHEKLFWEFTTSVHGETKGRKITCMVCHPADSLADLTRRDLLLEVRQCAACHRDTSHVRNFFRGFHYRSLTRGNRRAPSCPDCHTAHRVLPDDDDESSTHRDRLAATCGSGALKSAGGRCHGDLSGKTVQGAGMTSLVLPGETFGTTGWIFSLLYWGLLALLLLRAIVGAVRGR